jgi:hypothetical protein
MHRQNNGFKAAIGVPEPIQPLDLIHLLLKIPPYPCRPISYTTNRYSLKPPEGDYGLTVYRSKSLSVEIENHYSPISDKLVADTLKNLASLDKVHDKYSKTFEELYSELEVPAALYYAAIEYGLVEPENTVWLAQQYIGHKLYGRAAKLLESLTVP